MPDAPAQQLMLDIPLDRPWVTANFKETHLKKMRPGQRVTGNYVKVVQRVPVRIQFKPGQDPNHNLRFGMSVDPKVWLDSK